MITRLEILDFKTIFPTENSQNYLKDIPQDLLIDTASYLASFHPDNDFVRYHRVLLFKWFGKSNNKLANEINEKINKYNETKHYKTTILNPRTSLKLFELVLVNNKKVDKISNDEFEILLIPRR